MKEEDKQTEVGNDAYYCVVDIPFDLGQAGMDTSEHSVERYREAFSDALEEILGASVVLVSESEASYYRDKGYLPVPNAAWQRAHDMVREAGL